MDCHAHNNLKHQDYTMRGFINRAQHLSLVVLICVAVWAVTGGGFWPEWVMLGVGIVLAKRAYRTFVQQPVGAD